MLKSESVLENKMHKILLGFSDKNKPLNLSQNNRLSDN